MKVVKTSYLLVVGRPAYALLGLVLSLTSRWDRGRINIDGIEFAGGVLHTDDDPKTAGIGVLVVDPRQDEACRRCLARRSPETVRSKLEGLTLVSPLPDTTNSDLSIGAKNICGPVDAIHDIPADRSYWGNSLGLPYNILKPKAID
jgi:hypothetical protein